MSHTIEAYEAQRAYAAINIARAVAAGRDPETFDLVAFAAAESALVDLTLAGLEAAR
jgi:hypothetical protein